jgi:hypothetical protein
MSGHCGWFCRERVGPASPEVIAAMAAPLNRFDGCDVTFSRRPDSAISSLPFASRSRQYYLNG